MTKRKFIYLFCYLAYASIYTARVNLSIANPALTAAGILNTVEIGILGGAFSAVYAAGRLFNGFIGDKAPPPLMIGAGLLICGAANACIGAFPPFVAILLLWSANAYAQSMLWGALIALMAALYDERTAKKRTAFLSTSIAVGNIVGILLCSWLTVRFGARYAFIVPGLITLVLGVSIGVVMRDVPPHVSDAPHLSFWQLLRRRELQIVAVPAFIHGILKENVSLWMTVYIVDTYGVDLGGSAYYLLLIPIFGFLGRFTHRFFYRLAGENEHKVSICAFILAALVSLMAAFRVSALYGILCLTFLYGAASTINTSFLSIYPHRFRRQGNVSSVGGIVDFATYLGASAGSLVGGVLIYHFGYSSMFILWAVLSVAGAAVLAKFIHSRGQSQ